MAAELVTGDAAWVTVLFLVLIITGTTISVLYGRYKAEEERREKEELQLIKAFRNEYRRRPQNWKRP